MLARIITIICIFSSIGCFAQQMETSYREIRDSTLGVGKFNIDSLIGSWRRIGSASPAGCSNSGKDSLVRIEVSPAEEYVTIQKTSEGNYLVTYKNKMYAGKKRKNSILFETPAQTYPMGAFRLNGQTYVAIEVDGRGYYCANVFIYQKF